MTEREFKSVFDSALDGILILDHRGTCLEANPAAQALFGAQRDELVGHAIGEFYANGSDMAGARKWFLDGKDDLNETQTIRKDGTITFVEYTAKADYLPGKHVAVLRDISAHKSSEEQIARSLSAAESAWAEAEAFRRTTLALTQNLSMDHVLDTLLHSLLGLVPCDLAQILLVEADCRLFLAREMRHDEASRRVPKSPATLNAGENRFLVQVLATRNGLPVPDSAEEEDWVSFRGSPSVLALRAAHCLGTCARSCVSG